MSLKSVERSIDVLECFSTKNAAELRFTELQGMLGLPKGSLYRLLSTLEGRGFLTRTTSGGYSLGVALWELGTVFINNLDVRRVSVPYLKKLGEEGGEIVHLVILDGSDVITLEKIESRQAVVPYTYIGSRAPSHGSAAGKAILAYGPPELVERVIVAGLKRHTEHTITDPDFFRAELAKVRAVGYAVNREEWRYDVCGLAVPLRGHDGGVLAAINFTVPTVRFRPAQTRRFVDLLLQAADAISRELGYPGNQRRGADAKPPSEGQEWKRNQQPAGRRQP